MSIGDGAEPNGFTYSPQKMLKCLTTPSGANASARAWGKDLVIWTRQKGEAPVQEGVTSYIWNPETSTLHLLRTRTILSAWRRYSEWVSEHFEKIVFLGAGGRFEPVIFKLCRGLIRWDTYGTVSRERVKRHFLESAETLRVSGGWPTSHPRPARGEV